MNDFYEFSDLKLGMRINAEGQYQADGTLHATMLSIKDDSDADEFEANLESVDTATGTLRVLGLTVQAGAGVEIKDVDKRPLTVAALQPGMRIKVKGRHRGARFFQPEKIKVKLHSPDEQDEIEATITALDAGNHILTVMGFQIACDADVEIEA